jgi:hypothetical protein
MNVGARMETQGAERVKGTESLDSASRDQFVLMDEVTWLSVTPSRPGPCRLLPGLEDVVDLLPQGEVCRTAQPVCHARHRVAPRSVGSIDFDEGKARCLGRRRSR